MSEAIGQEPALTPGEFDPNSLPELLGKDNPVIVDIGCNDGSHTQRFRSLFKEAKVYSFAPDPRAQERFRKQVTDERAKLFAVAISAVDGTTGFYTSGGYHSEDCREPLPEGWDLSGSIRKPGDHLQVHPWCTFDKIIKVRTQKLDTWCVEEGVETIDFIWADVQGAEVNLIEGGQAALGRTRYFYTEYCDRELYEGQVNLQTILKILPHFDVLNRYENDVLLRNKRYS